MAKVAAVEQAPSRRRILIIEDHVETRILYGEHFQRVGYDAETAEGGNAGMAAALRTLGSDADSQRDSLQLAKQLAGG